MSRLKVGVIGLGNMGRHHVRIYSELPSVELVAVCDPIARQAQQFASRYGCQAYTDTDTFLRASGVQAISITSPTSTHFALARSALMAGIHVLVEKPISETVAEADALIDLATEKQLTLTVGHIERFNPAIVALLTRVRQDVLGSITSLLGRRASPMPTQIQDANVMIDLAVHDIDIFCALFGAVPTEVIGSTGRALISDREDHAELFLRYPSGSAYLAVNWITPVKIRTLAVTGSKAYAEVNYIDQTLTLWKTDGTAEVISVDRQEPIRLELAHFVDCVLHQKPPAVSATDGRNALSIALKTLDQLV